MVVEHFKKGKVNEAYARYASKGRMLPEGLCYLNSWVNKEEHICFQLMETNDERLFSQWIEKWNDLVDFEITEVS